MGQQQYEGILDTLGIAGNMVLGFSLYRLVVGYEGYCLRVRRSSDDEELDIGFDSNGYIDVVTLESFCSGIDGFVSIWYNQYASGNNALQTTNGYQPQIVSSGSLLSNGLRFDGTDDSLTVSNYDVLNSLGTSATFFYKVKILTTPSYPNEGMIFSKNRWNQYRCGSLYSAVDRLSMKASSIKDVDLTYILNVNYDRLIEYNGIHINDYKNGILSSTIPLSGDMVSTSANLYLGSNAELDSFLNYEIKALLIFNSNEYDNYNDLANNI